MPKRTDLAVEEKALWEESAGKTTKLEGVRARESRHRGVEITTVEILDEDGVQALRKPVGTYVTMELSAFRRRERDSFSRSAEALGKQLRDLLRMKKGESVLVVGLGNRSVTPDAIGPRALDSVLVTRHLVDRMPEFFSDYRPASAAAPGVLGVTGMESAEVVEGLVEKVRPDRMIVVDALAARSLDRICTTVQLTDTGITPGSGIDNAREGFNRQRFGIPVVAVGVPTVVDMDTLLQDFGAAGTGPKSSERKMIVTSCDIDILVSRVARLVGYGVNLALHDSLTVEDVGYFVE